MPRELYDMILIFYGGFFLLVGLYMFLEPEKVMKKENRNIPLEVEKAKRNGMIAAFCGILLVYLGMFGNSR